jgi:hypothetical protein
MTFISDKELNDEENVRKFIIFLENCEMRKIRR